MDLDGALFARGVSPTSAIARSRAAMSPPAASSIRAPGVVARSARGPAHHLAGQRRRSSLLPAVRHEPRGRCHRHRVALQLRRIDLPQVVVAQWM